MTAIDPKELKEFEKSYLKDDKARVVRNALTVNDLSKIAVVQEARESNPFVFSIDIPTMPATNQQKSGRCWIFSSMNVLREMIAKKCKIKDFELSQNYIAFYDKLEKINWYMNCCIQELDKPFDDRTLEWLMHWPIGDGGQWDMVVSIVKKYGLCPKSAMPETYQSSNTMAMNGLINTRLRKFVVDAKKMDREKVEAYREETLKELYGFLCSCFGVPPKSFTFEYTDEKGKYHADYNQTPAKFAKKYLPVDLDDYVILIHAPTEDKPYHKMYSVKYIGNVVGGNEIRYLNLPMDEFKEAVLNQLKAGEPVWFGCDCGKFGNRDEGLWDEGAFDYEHTFDLNLSMSKAEMLDAHHSAMNHAMVLTGVNIAGDGKPNRWKIENSWGKDVAHGGYYMCTDTWFDSYMYEVAVHKKYLTEEQKKCLKQKVTVLQPWDPFGTLAD